jgi:hypothetical protein
VDQIQLNIDESLNIFSKDLNLEISSLNFIQENKYCVIYSASTPAGKKIVKKYKGENPSLARTEAKALELYHAFAAEDGELIDSGYPILKEDKNLLLIGFVTGQPFNEFIYRAAREKSLQFSCEQHMFSLGKLLKKIRAETTQPSEPVSPFLFEYFDYTSRRLRNSKVFGSLLFKGVVEVSEQIKAGFQMSGEAPSFIHGDLVFKNIHVTNDRLGLIDFANANYFSHPLNDIYNLQLSLANMLIPNRLKQKLLVAFYHGLGEMDFSSATHRFYYEYHRRRWLMLKLLSRNPIDVLQGFRGFFSFAKPFSPELIRQ